VGAVVSFFAGPTVIGLLFGDRYALSGTAIGILAVGACLYLGVMISGQALVAGGRHRASTAAWSCGLLVAVLVFAVVPGLVPRATLAFTLGSAAALAAAALFLLYSRPTADAPVPDGPALEGTFPAGPA
jgi:O-antigen/teichoic acid export membrane protein